MEHNKDHHHEVKKIWFNSDNTNHWTSFVYMADRFGALDKWAVVQRHDALLIHPKRQRAVIK